ncbi:regulatory protein RecX [Streptacidiphilus fuscans]|uniref:Regulatory protein RecX n=1 Tax=Streptacidiphilus fuscans TaxID=2789292 RepID=A0A931BEH8_9ACTN|nr:regulatory protein RecX [Streptacidiphilus fuscans]MBF9073797.1 regulatory protein RecX [Streptacidiphilus fuscans]
MSSDSAWGPRDWCANGIGGEEEQQENLAGPETDPSPAPFATEPTPAVAARTRRRGGRKRRERGEDDEGNESRAEVTDPAARARDICLRQLTGSARTRRQLADALRRKEIPDEVAEEVLDRLEQVGLIDDAAYAEAWVEQRQRHRGLARRALASELRAKGVAGDLVQRAVAQVEPEDEEAAARRLVERKLRSTAGLERQVRLRRLAGMLARRGYPEGLALRVVRSALDAESFDPEQSGPETFDLESME